MKKKYECTSCQRMTNLVVEEDELTLVKFCPYCGSTKIQQYTPVKREDQYKELYDQKKTCTEVAKIMDVTEMTAYNHYFALHMQYPENYPIDDFIQPEYEAKILEIANRPDYNYLLKTIKAELPEQATYNCIKAVLAKQKLLKRNY